MYSEQAQDAANSDTGATPVPGQRTITCHPEKPETDLWQGRIDHDAFREHAWHARTIEQVMHRMDEALGKQPEDSYAIVE